MRLFYWILVNTAGVGLATILLKGIETDAKLNSVEGATTIVLVGVIFGLINSLVKPVVKFFATPAIFLTLGLALLLVNAAMLLLTSWVSGKFDVGFQVNGWWAAILGSIIISIASFILGRVLYDEDDQD